MEATKLEHNYKGAVQAGNDAAGAEVPASWPLRLVLPRGSYANDSRLHMEP